MLFFFCFDNYILCIRNFIEIPVIFMIRLRNSVFKPFQRTICKSRINRIFCTTNCQTKCKVLE